VVYMYVGGFQTSATSYTGYRPWMAYNMWDSTGKELVTGMLTLTKKQVSP